MSRFSKFVAALSLVGILGTICYIDAAATGTAYADGPFGTKAAYVLGKMFNSHGNFAFLNVASDPFTCGSADKGTVYYNTGSNVVKVCNGTAFSAVVVATATPAPTATNTPTPTATSTSTSTPTPIPLPLSLANGGFGLDYSSPAPLLKQQKDMGHAAAQGGFAAQSFVRATVTAGNSFQARIDWHWVASDGTHLSNFGGHFIFTCEQEVTGGLMSASKTSVSAGNQNDAGSSTTVGSLNVTAAAFATSTGTGTCDLTMAGTVGTGTATSNTLYWDAWPLGVGTLSAQ